MTDKPNIVAGPPVFGSDFFGREAEVERFWAEVRSGHNLLLISPRRVGKTSLMRHVEEHPRDDWTPVFVDFQGRPGAASVIAAIVHALGDRGGVAGRVAHKFRELIGAVELEGEAFGVTLRTRVRDDWDTLSVSFERATAAAVSEGGRLMLIIDEFPIVIRDLFTEPDKSKEQESAREAVLLLQLFRRVRIDKSLAPKFRMIVGGSIGLKPILRRFQVNADANDLKPFHLGPWSEETARAFMARVGEANGLELSAEVQEAVLRRTGMAPLPYHVQTLLLRLEEKHGTGTPISVAAVDSAADEIVGDLQLEHYRDRFGDVLEPDAAIAAADMMAAVAKNSPQPRETLLALANKEGPGREAMRVLEDDGYLIADGNDALNFANPMLAAFWRRY